MKRIFSLLSIVLFCSPLFISLPQAFSQPAQPPAWAAGRLKQRLQASGRMDEFRHIVLSAIAFYPDEVIAAIFEVAQEPATLVRGEKSENPSYNQALEFLSVYPMVLQDLKTHPFMTRAIGMAAVRNPEGAWRAIDDFRAKYREQSGVPVADALVSEEAPPVVVIPSSEGAEITDVTQTTEDAVVVDLSPSIVYVEEAADSGVVYTEAYPDSVVVVVPEEVYVDSVVAGGVVVGENAVAAGAAGVVVTEDGDVVAGHAGGAVIETNNGAVAVGGAGHTTVDPDDGTMHHEGTVGAINQDGQGAIAHREADTAWDQNSLQRSVEGQAQTTGGAGAEWEREKSLERTEEGFVKETSKHIETNDGRSADVDRTLEKTDDGVSVDRTAEVTNREGETQQWENSRDFGQSSSQEKSAKSAQPAQKQAAEGLASKAGGSLASTKPAWDYFKGGENKSAASQFSRPQSIAKSAEAFSGQSLNRNQLNTAMSRGNSLQNRTLQSLDSGRASTPRSQLQPQQSFQRPSSTRKNLNRQESGGQSFQGRGSARRSGSRSGGVPRGGGGRRR